MAWFHNAVTKIVFVTVARSFLWYLSRTQTSVRSMQLALRSVHPKLEDPILPTRRHLFTVRAPIHGVHLTMFAFISISHNLSFTTVYNSIMNQRAQVDRSKQLRRTSSAWPGRSCFNLCVRISQTWIGHTHRMHQHATDTRREIQWFAKSS
jgi:hypothetical protein